MAGFVQDPMRMPTLGSNDQLARTTINHGSVLSGAPNAAQRRPPHPMLAKMYPQLMPATPEGVRKKQISFPGGPGLLNKQGEGPMATPSLSPLPTPTASAIKALGSNPAIYKAPAPKVFKPQVQESVLDVPLNFAGDQRKDFRHLISTETPGKHISPWYSRVPGGFNAAVLGAQKAISQNNLPGDPTQQAMTYRDRWPSWSASTLNQPTTAHWLTPENLKNIYSDPEEVSGISSGLGGDLLVKHPAQGKPELTQRVLEHELTHSMFPRNPRSRYTDLWDPAQPTKQPLSPYQRPEAQQPISRLPNGEAVGPEMSSFVDRAKHDYFTSPAEVDPRLAEIKRHYAYATGKLVTTPEEAQQAVQWWTKQSPEQRKQTTMEDVWDQYYQALPDEQKQELYKRMPELVQNEGKRMGKTVQASATSYGPNGVIYKPGEGPVTSKVPASTPLKASPQLPQPMSPQGNQVPGSVATHGMAPPMPTSMPMGKSAVTLGLWSLCKQSQNPLAKGGNIVLTETESTGEASPMSDITRPFSSISPANTAFPGKYASVLRSSASGEVRPKWKPAPDARNSAVSLSDVARTKKVDSVMPPTGTGGFLFKKAEGLSPLSEQDIPQGNPAVNPFARYENDSYGRGVDPARVLPGQGRGGQHAIPSDIVNYEEVKPDNPYPAGPPSPMPAPSSPESAAALAPAAPPVNPAMRAPMQLQGGSAAGPNGNYGYPADFEAPIGYQSQPKMHPGYQPSAADRLTGEMRRDMPQQVAPQRVSALGNQALAAPPIPGLAELQAKSQELGIGPNEQLARHINANTYQQDYEDYQNMQGVARQALADEQAQRSWARSNLGPVTRGLGNGFRALQGEIFTGAGALADVGGLAGNLVTEPLKWMAPNSEFVAGLDEGADKMREWGLRTARSGLKDVGRSVDPRMNADYTNRPQHAYNPQTYATMDEYNKIRQEAEPFKQDAVNTGLRGGADAAMGVAQQAMETIPYAVLGGGLAMLPGRLGTVGRAVNWLTGADKKMLGLNAAFGAAQGLAEGHAPKPIFDREPYQAPLPQGVHDIAYGKMPIQAKDYAPGPGANDWSAGALATQMSGQGAWDPNSPIGERKDLPSGAEMINDYAMQPGPQAPANPAAQAPVMPVSAQAPQASAPPEWASRFQPQIQRAQRAGNTGEVRRLERMQAQAPESVQPNQRPDYVKWNNPSLANSGQTQAVGGQPQQMMAPPMPAPQPAEASNQQQASGQNAPAPSNAAPSEPSAAPIPRPAPSNPGYEGLSADEVLAKERAETEARLNAPVMPSGMSQQGQEAWGAQQRMNRNRANREFVDNQLSGDGTRLMGSNGMAIQAPGGGYLPSTAGGSGRQLSPVLGRDGRPVLRPDGSPMIAAAKDPEPQYSLSPAQISMREAMRQKYERAEAMRRTGSPTYPAGGQPAGPGQAPQMRQPQEMMANNPATQAPMPGARKPDPSQDVAGGSGGRMMAGTNPGPALRTPGMQPQSFPVAQGRSNMNVMTDPKIMQQTHGTFSPPSQAQAKTPTPTGNLRPASVSAPKSPFQTKMSGSKEAGVMSALGQVGKSFSRGGAKMLKRAPGLADDAVRGVAGVADDAMRGGAGMADDMAKSVANMGPTVNPATRAPLSKEPGLWYKLTQQPGRPRYKGTLPPSGDVAQSVPASQNLLLAQRAADGARVPTARVPVSRAGKHMQILKSKGWYDGPIDMVDDAGKAIASPATAAPVLKPPLAGAQGAVQAGMGRGADMLGQGAGMLGRGAKTTAKAVGPLAGKLVGPAATGAVGLGLINHGVNQYRGMMDEGANKFQGMIDKGVQQAQGMMDQAGTKAQGILDQAGAQSQKLLGGAENIQGAVTQGIQGAMPNMAGMANSPTLQSIAGLFQGGGFLPLLKSLFSAGKDNIKADYSNLASSFKQPQSPALSAPAPEANDDRLNQLVMSLLRQREGDSNANFWQQNNQPVGTGTVLANATG